MPYAAALSENTDGVAAASEAADLVLEQIGLGAHAVLAFFSGFGPEIAGDMAQVIRDRLLPASLLGASAVSVVAGDREIEERPAVSLWAGNVGSARPARFRAYRGDDGLHLEGPPGETMTSAHTLILVSDPFTYPADALVRTLGDSHPELTVVGGMASASNHPGGNRLFLDDEVFTNGAVGLLLSGPARVTTVVSQGCRPIGSVLVVTAAEGNVIHELAGKPAYEQVSSLLSRLDPEERRLATQGLQIGRVIDEHKLEFDRGDFLVRSVISADRDNGTVTVGDIVPVGTSIQLQVRDADSADIDLRELMTSKTADGAVVFTCNGRGTNMFDSPDHDALVVAANLGAVPTSGMFCAGELGPVGSQNFLHTYTASIALFHDE